MRARRMFGPIALVAALALSMTGTASATPGGQVEREATPPWELEDRPSSGGFIDGLWFVELSAEPEARGGSATAHADERTQLQAEARDTGAAFTERSSFTQLWNGLTVEADDADAARLRQLDSVEAVYPVAEIERPEPADAAPELGTALEMTGANATQSELGLTGAGLSVAIIDTGIDYNHPDLGGDGDPTVVYTAASADDRSLTDTDGEGHPRITHGWDYVGDGFDASDPDTPDPDPNPDPMDPQGHGTHVAGITGADGEVTGVAPDVTFGAYKVFDVGSTTAEVILDALEDAYDDGMDIVNMSLGAAFAWGQDYPTTAMSNELAAQGVTVVNSAGNSGGDGMWSLSAPANAHDIISVASADNTEMMANYFEVEELGNDEPQRVPWLGMVGAGLPPEVDHSDPLAVPPVVEIDEEEGRFGCDPDDFDDEDFDGKTALVERGHCFFADKYENAADAGATAVVIYNNVPGLFAGTIEEAGRENIWSAAIGQEDGRNLASLLEDDEQVTLGFTEHDDLISAPSPTAGLVSSFSSYGQDVELEFGPSVLAPGGFITSTYPLDLGEYAMLSGTSMSAPHVAGAVALLWEAEPELDPFEVRDRLQNTAEQVEWSGAPGAGVIEKVVRQGAGMIQIDQAILADQHAVPGQISIGEEAAVTTTIEVFNQGGEDVGYELGHLGAIAGSVTTFAPVGLGPGAVVDAPDSVVVPAGGSAQIDVTISAPGFGLANHQYGGYITLTPTEGGAATLSVPYVGYDGDYQELPLFGFFVWPLGEPVQFVEQEPFLSEFVEIDDDGDVVTTDPVDAGHEFILRDGQYPVIEAFFGHFPQKMEVFAVSDDGERRLVLSDEHLPRSPGPEDRWPFVWDGTTAAGQSDNSRPLASGTYTLEVEVLRALGDPGNEHHWDTWESPEFELDSRRGRPGGPVDRPGGPGNGGPGGGNGNGR